MKADTVVKTRAHRLALDKQLRDPANVWFITTRGDNAHQCFAYGWTQLIQKLGMFIFGTMPKEGDGHYEEWTQHTNRLLEPTAWNWYGAGEDHLPYNIEYLFEDGCVEVTRIHQDAFNVPVRLQCPVCHADHIDEINPSRGWFNPPHKSHECQHCGYIWRPSHVTTQGVQDVPTRGLRDHTLPATLAVNEGIYRTTGVTEDATFGGRPLMPIVNWIGQPVALAIGGTGKPLHQHAQELAAALEQYDVQQRQIVRLKALYRRTDIPEVVRVRLILTENQFKPGVVIADMGLNEKAHIAFMRLTPGIVHELEDVKTHAPAQEA